jgi:hypothetical protein
MRVPKHIINYSGEKYTFSGFDFTGLRLIYSSKELLRNLVLAPSQIETRWSKVGRPKAQSIIINQDRWTCAPAAVAMLLDIGHFESKRGFAKAGWQNNDSGLSEEVLFKGVSHLGEMLVEVPSLRENESGLILCRSLNIPSLTHMVCWNGSEILDPNTSIAGRNWWGPEWSPETIPGLKFYRLRKAEKRLPLLPKEFELSVT